MSRIAEAIKLQGSPVAVYRTSVLPENALQLKPGIWSCVVALLNAAAFHHRIAACSLETVTCPGGKIGLGMKPFEPGFLEYYLSDGREDLPFAEHYKLTPEHAMAYYTNLPKTRVTDYLVFCPMDQLNGAVPEEMIFMVNADQMSALATLANYDSMEQDQVRLLFGSGCMQSILPGLEQQERGGKNCFIGLIDPSARKCIAKDLMSFSIPYHRFLEMEENVAGSFLETKTWQTIRNRI